MSLNKLYITYIIYIERESAFHSLLSGHLLTDLAKFCLF